MAGPPLARHGHVTQAGRGCHLLSGILTQKETPAGADWVEWGCGKDTCFLDPASDSGLGAPQPWFFSLSFYSMSMLWVPNKILLLPLVKTKSVSVVMNQNLYLLHLASGLLSAWFPSMFSDYHLLSKIVSALLTAGAPEPRTASITWDALKNWMLDKWLITQFPKPVVKFPQPPSQQSRVKLAQQKWSI